MARLREFLRVFDDNLKSLVLFGAVVARYWPLRSRRATKRRAEGALARQEHTSGVNPCSHLDLSEDRAARRARKRAVAVQVEFAEQGRYAFDPGRPRALIRPATRSSRVSTANAGLWPGTRLTPATRRSHPTDRASRGLIASVHGWYGPSSMTEAFDVTLDGDRGTLRGHAGDWLVQYAPSDFSVVSAACFAQTYELLD